MLSLIVFSNKSLLIHNSFAAEKCFHCLTLVVEPEGRFLDLQ